jgi:hypothetical protein
MFGVDALVMFDVESFADWRHLRAEQFPDDSRNMRAALLLDRLAADLKAPDEVEAHRRLNDAVQRSGLHGVEIVRIISEELRRVGFQSSPDSGIDLLESIIAKVEVTKAEMPLS